MKRIIIILTLIMVTPCQAMIQKGQYQVIREQDRVIHLVKLNPKYYLPVLVKAKNGRETVANIAQNNQAAVAINAGFFKISDTKNGEPAFDLVINNKVYNLTKKLNAQLIIKNGKLSIKEVDAKEFLNSNQNNDISLVTGTPMLVQNSRVNRGIATYKSSFYTKSHARTAIGLTDDNIVIAIVENSYKKDINSLSLKQILVILEQNKDKITEKYNKSISELYPNEIIDILKQSLNDEQEPKGMSLINLAHFMQEQGCLDAINLDGGGSSTLVIDGTMKNIAFGDIDESQGMQIARPVGDALLFIAK